MTAAEFAARFLGQRVTLTDTIGDFPIVPVPAGKTGTVVEMGEPGYYGIRLDEVRDDLAEWGNVLALNDWFTVDTDVLDIDWDAVARHIAIVEV